MPGRRDIAVKQSIPPALRYNMQDFNREFPDDDACLMYIFEQRWPRGIAQCEKCNKETKHHRVTGRTAFACDRCGWHIYPLAGTIFEKSSTSLQKWFHAMYQMGSTRCGISAKQIQRETSVTYKTAWRMFKQIRALMSEDGLQLEGLSVEIDETYDGGVTKGGNGRPMRGDRGKTPIVGIVERRGRAIARATKDATGATLLPLPRDYVLPKSTVYTDERKAYGEIDNIEKPDGTNARLVHRRINHVPHIYVHADIHTNSVEGFLSLIKRCIGGVYHSVSAKILAGLFEWVLVALQSARLWQPSVQGAFG